MGFTRVARASCCPTCGQDKVDPSTTTPSGNDPASTRVFTTCLDLLAAYSMVGAPGRERKWPVDGAIRHWARRPFREACLSSRQVDRRNLELLEAAS